MTGYSKCLTCTHDKRLEAERMYMQGQSIAHISRTFGIPYDSVSHHMSEHLSRQLVQHFRKQSSMESVNMMSKFTVLIQDIQDQIDRFKIAGKDALTLKATDTLIRLYSVMCQFASVFYQQQGAEHEQERLKDDEQREQKFSEDLQVLSDDELSVLEQLQQKVELQDPDMKIKLDHFEEFHPPAPRLQRMKAKKGCNDIAEGEITQQNEDKQANSRDKDVEPDTDSKPHKETIEEFNKRIEASEPGQKHMYRNGRIIPNGTEKLFAHRVKGDVIIHTLQDRK